MKSTPEYFHTKKLLVKMLVKSIPDEGRKILPNDEEPEFHVSKLELPAPMTSLGIDAALEPREDPGHKFFRTLGPKILK